MSERVIYENRNLWDTYPIKPFKIKIENWHDDTYYRSIIEWVIEKPGEIRISVNDSEFTTKGEEDDMVL